MLDKPTPVTRSGPPPSAPSARKYEADDASPSTKISRGEVYAAAASMVNVDQPSRATVTPNRAMRFKVISIYGLEINSPMTCIVTLRAICAASNGAAINTAVRNWLDTLPLILKLKSPAGNTAGDSLNGGKPALP